ncbi:hypothetical protein TNCV_1918961 [Trichonephila clavipes]|nr:hypothetical protein TNCV_1918961 [Trichonephila clavipes]
MKVTRRQIGLTSEEIAIVAEHQYGQYQVQLVTSYSQPWPSRTFAFTKTDSCFKLIILPKNVINIWRMTPNLIRNARYTVIADSVFVNRRRRNAFCLLVVIFLLVHRSARKGEN